MTNPLAGSQLLEFAVESAKKKEVEDVYLHVQVSNDDALNFYKKQGFLVADTIKDYYKKIEPRDCYVLKRQIK